MTSDKIILVFIVVEEKQKSLAYNRLLMCETRAAKPDVLTGYVTAVVKYLFSSLSSVIVRVNVVLKRTVGDSD